MIAVSELRRPATCVHRPYRIPLVTPLRRDLVNCLLAGMTHKEAAKVLQRNHKTLEKHVADMTKRAGCKTSAQFLAALAVAVERGETWMWNA